MYMIGGITNYECRSACKDVSCHAYAAGKGGQMNLRYCFIYGEDGTLPEWTKHKATETVVQQTDNDTKAECFVHVLGDFDFCGSFRSESLHRNRPFSTQNRSDDGGTYKH